MRRAGAALCTAAALLAGCGGSGAGPRTVAIGVIHQSKFEFTENSSYRAGAQLAVTRLNALAQGRYVFELRSRDSAGADAARTVALLRQDTDVVGIVGPLTSQQVLEAAPELDRPGHGKLDPVVALAPVATNPSLSGLNPWLFRLAPDDGELAAAAAHFAFDSLGARRVLVLFANDAYGRDWARMFSTSFLAFGGRTVTSDRAMFSDSTWWETYIAYVRRMAPDVIVVPGTDHREYGWVWQLRARGVRTTILFGDGGAELTEEDDHLPGLFYVGFYDRATPPNAEAARFVRDFEANYEGLARQTPSHAYDATLAIGMAVLAVGPDRRRIRDYLEQLERNPIEGATGMIAFDARHNRTGSPVQLSRIP